MYCQIYGCNEREGIQQHHLIPRSQSSSSDEPWNKFNICWKHHSQVTEKKLDMVVELEKLQCSPIFIWGRALKWLRDRKELTLLKKDTNA